MIFQFGTWFGNCLLDFTKNMHTSFFCLVQSTFQNFIRETVYFNVHLGSCNTVFGTCYFEVHITQVVFITEDVRQYCIFFFAGVLNQSHSDARYRFLNLHTGIHQGQSSGAYSSHGWRTVWFKDIWNNTYYIWVIFRNHSLQCSVCQITVPNFTTAYATLSFCFTCWERREVIVQ